MPARLAVTPEPIVILPFVRVILWQSGHIDRGFSGVRDRTTARLLLSGTMIVIPMILRSCGTKSLTMSSVGLISKVNPIV